MLAYITDKVSSPSCLKNPKGHTFKFPRKKVKRNLWKVGMRMGHKHKKEKTEGATGLCRITREQTESWNQMTVLRFQTGGRLQKNPASLWAISANDPPPPSQSMECVCLCLRVSTCMCMCVWGYF